MKNPTGSRRLAWVTVLAILVGVGLRAAGSRGELWLDEIWSIQLAGQVASPVDILTRLSLDNNHPLNTLFLWLLGDTPQGFLYRLPAVLAGAGTLALTGAVAASVLPAAETVLATWLVALCFPLIVYDSEARGYAPAIFFSFLCFLLVERFLARRGPGTVVLFTLCALLGFLSHATFLFVFLALGLSAAVGVCRSGIGAARAAGSFTVLFLPPTLLIALVAYPLLRHLQYGGGPQESLGSALRALLLSVVGLPAWFAAGTAIAAAVAVVLGFAVAFLFRSRNRAWPFFAALMAVPLAGVLILRPPLLYLRYFLVCLPFLLILLAGLLGRLWRTGAAGHLAGAVLLAAILAGNGVRIARFLKFGRGQYREAVQEMGRASTGSVISVTSDHDFRNGMVLAYEARLFLPPGRPLLYVPMRSRAAGTTEWLIRHSAGPVAPVPSDLRFGDGVGYRLWKVYPYCGELSGFNWYLYRRQKG